MKTACLLLAFLCLLTHADGQQQNIDGNWMGKFGGQIAWVFHFDRNAELVSGTFDSPNEGAFGIPISRVDFAGDTVTVKIDSLKATYKGIMKNDTTLSGVWQQGAATLPIAFKKMSGLRPQTPVPPYPYNSEEVVYENADKSIRFGATFTYPEKGGPFVTAVMITGSGAEDRDETVMGHKPFAVIADYLTKNGYAVLRIDDRGVGKTTGSSKGITSEDQAGDVLAALAYLKARKEVNVHKIGLIGHSEGGFIADIAAAKNPDDIHFIISLAGMGAPGATIIADQNMAILLKRGMPLTSAAAYKDFFIQFADLMNSTPAADSAALPGRALGVYRQWQKSLPDSVAGTLGIRGDEQGSMLVQRLVKVFSTPGMKYTLAADPGKYIARLSCKYLALNGGEDVQVLPASNLGAIKEAILKSNIKVYEVKELKGLNHIFQHCHSCTVSEYAEIEETFAPEALEAMTLWLNKFVK